MLTGKGGMVAYLGTNSFIDIWKMAESGNEKARLICDAAAYQVAKEIGSMSAVLNGEVDAIILTGGMAYEVPYVKSIEDKVRSIAKLVVYPGEDEMKALAFNGLLALDGKIEIKNYS
jgi:butyrate kinase